MDDIPDKEEAPPQESPDSETPVVPLEVKIINKDKVKTIYDDAPDEEYDDLQITQKEIEDFENGNT